MPRQICGLSIYVVSEKNAALVKTNAAVWHKSMAAMIALGEWCSP